MNVSYVGSQTVDTLRAKVQYSYFEISLKPAVVGCLTNAIVSLLIALRPVQGLKWIGQSSSLHSKKFFLLGVVVFL